MCCWNTHLWQVRLTVREVPGGGCSPWLCSLCPGDLVECLPPRSASPLRSAWEARIASGPVLQLLLVANGAGLAPFLALLESLGQEPGPRPQVWLWVGCRTRQGGLPHAERLTAFQAEGVLHRLSVAESRPAAPDMPKRWVQDLLAAEVEEVGQLLFLALDRDGSFRMLW